VSLRRTAAIARRIVQEFRRDPRSLGLVFIAPLAILALLGWVLREEHPPTTNLGIVNLAGAVADTDATNLSQAMQIDGITIVDVGPDEAAGDQALRDGRADVVIVIPATFASDTANGAAPNLEIVTLGLSPAEDASRISLVAQAIGLTLPAPGSTQLVHRSVLDSPDDTLDVYAPGLISFFGFFFVFILTGISFLRERIGGTLERLLATPVGRLEIVVGYCAGFGYFAMLQVMVILFFSFSTLALEGSAILPRLPVGLGIQSAGSPIFAFLVLVLLALGAVNLGIFISTFARTELQVLQFIPIVVVPQALLAGVILPVGSLPDPLQVVARLMPITYAVNGLREVFVRGSDLSSPALQLDVAVLAGMAILFGVLATFTIRREVA
jgi:ABC-2 type transport system permease protein